MHYILILAAFGAIAPALAEELGASDVPAACNAICRPIVTLTNICDIDPNEADNDKDDDKRRKLRLRDEDAEEAIEANCICTNKSFDVAIVMALCQSCIKQTGKKSEDVDKIMKQCSFKSASYTPEATSVLAGIQVQATKPALVPVTAPTATGGSASPSTTTPGKSAGSKTVIPIVAAIGAGLAAALFL